MSSVQIIHEQIAAIRAERRRFRRLKAAVQTEMRVDGSKVPIRAETADLSEGGCYVEMPLTIERDKQLHIVLWLNHKKLVMRARIATCHPQFGNGIEFLNVSAEDRKELHNFIEAGALPLSVDYWGDVAPKMLM